MLLRGRMNKFDELVCYTLHLRTKNRALRYRRRSLLQIRLAAASQSTTIHCFSGLEIIRRVTVMACLQQVGRIVLNARKVGAKGAARVLTSERSTLTGLAE